MKRRIVPSVLPDAKDLRVGYYWTKVREFGEKYKKFYWPSVEILLNFIFNANEAMTGRKFIELSTQLADALPNEIYLAPAGAPPNPALWTVSQRRELIKNPVFWDRPENMGQYSDDTSHVFLDGNSNLVIRATRDAPGRYTSGKVVGNFGAGIGHTFEARVKFNCSRPRKLGSCQDACANANGSQ